MRFARPSHGVLPKLREEIRNFFVGHSKRRPHQALWGQVYRRHDSHRAPWSLKIPCFAVAQVHDHLVELVPAVAEQSPTQRAKVPLQVQPDNGAGEIGGGADHGGFGRRARG